MNNTSTTLRIATRQSPLALWQAHEVKQRLQHFHPQLKIEIIGMTTSGDRQLATSLASSGGKGLFVKELEQALLAKTADIAVHSMKDLPIYQPDGLTITAICPRSDPRDALISNHYLQFADLPFQAVIGTASLRRQSQLHALRPDLVVKLLRGNVNTRLQKLDAGDYDAIVLAAAGLNRLGLAHRISSLLSIEQCLPAVGQGAIGIECRSDDALTQNWVAALHDHHTAICIQAERAFNEQLQGGCQVPVAAYATFLTAEQLQLIGLVGKLDGSIILRDQLSGPIQQATEIGKQLAERLLAQGAEALLREFHDHATRN